MSDYETLFGPVGAFSGFDAQARSAAWRERLAINAPELAAFRALPDPDGPLHRAPAPSWSAGALRQLPQSLGGAAAIARDVAAGRRKAQALVAEALAAAAAHASLHAFVSLRDEAALDEARAIDAACAAGRAPGPLAGVPIAVKDLLAVTGSPLTGGTRARDASPPEHDAEVVRRLRAAGAIVIGQTNLHELAYGITSDNPHFGRVANPRDPRRIPGGSSGGSAAAVAAGIVPIAIGTDTAGSIRIPAACCGTVGFKPSFDAVPRDGGINLALSLDHVGPLAASVDDAIAAHAAMTGHAPSAETMRDSLAGVRIARLNDYFEHPLDASVADAVETACTLAAVDGAAVARRTFPNTSIAAALQFVTICSEATAEHWRMLHERAEQLGADVRVRLEIGQFFFAHDYVKAQRWRARFDRDALQLFGESDLLICPTLRTTAPSVGAATVRLGALEVPMHTAMTNLTMPFNLLGWPAITLPFGDDANGLPIAVQIVGPPGADDRVLGAARRLERLLRDRTGA